mmetsp:Transcript_14202/g.40525  ORF Transcript_14202/g.40525 Transcript_14202/m.40525 type:complete len:263 (+) Transcript_14202:3556-4344(+)
MGLLREGQSARRGNDAGGTEAAWRRPERGHRRRSRRSRRPRRSRRSKGREERRRRRRGTHTGDPVKVWAHRRHDPGHVVTNHSGDGHPAPPVRRWRQGLSPRPIADNGSGPGHVTPSPGFKRGCRRPGERDNVALVSQPRDHLQAHRDQVPLGRVDLRHSVAARLILFGVGNHFPGVPRGPPCRQHAEASAGGRAIDDVYWRAAESHVPKLDQIRVPGRRRGHCAFRLLDRSRRLARLLPVVRHDGQADHTVEGDRHVSTYD